MKRYLLSLTVLFAGWTAAWAQLGRYRADFALSIHDFIDTVAIEWTRHQVAVPVDIDGHRYRFLLDTGAGQTVIFSRSRLSTSLASTLIAHDATGRTDTVPVVTLPPLRIGHLTLSGCRALVQQATGMQQFDGILGFDLVNGGLTMKIDVSARRLILSDRSCLFCREPAHRLRYQLNYHVPYVEVTPFGRYRERVLFDTGSRQFYVINKEHFDDANYWRSQGGYTVEGRSQGSHAIGHFGTETTGEVVFLQLDNLRLGHYSFSHVHTLTTQGGSHLGAMILDYGAISFCPRHRRMLFLPSTTEQPCRVDNPQLEIAFVASPDGRPQVGLVWEQGTPYSQGLRQGDIITEIDHRPVATLAQFATWGFERGREYVFTLLDPQGRRREVRWVRLPFQNDNH